MTGRSAVGVNDDLAPGESCVSLGSPDDETPCGIDEKFCLPVNQIPGQHGIKYIFPDIPVNLFLAHVLVMLGGENHRFQAYGLAVFIVFHGYLALAVGP